MGKVKSAKLSDDMTGSKVARMLGNAKLTQSAMRLRALALELAIKAGPLTLGHNPTIKGSELCAQAELIEAWLKEAKP